MIYRCLIKLPILGVVIKVFNSYAFDGDLDSDDRCAGVLAWMKAFLLPFVISAAVSLMLMPETVSKIFPWCSGLDYKIKIMPGDLATSILPNLLGFGIGVYALVFALDSVLVRDLQQSFQKANETSKARGSALLLNTEMALPLVVLTLAIAVGVAQMIFSGSAFLVFFAWFSFWLSLYFILELVNTLYMMGSAHLSQSLKQKEH